MVATGVRVAVLTGAGLAHGELIHARAFPVIGNRADDAVPGSAVDTRGRPVALVPSPRGKNIVHARGTDCNIGRDHAGERTGRTFLYNKTIANNTGKISDLNRIDPGHWRAAGNRCNKIFEPVSPGDNLDLAPEVFYPAGNTELNGFCIDKRAEPDSLYDPANRDPPLFLHGQLAAKIY
jgi:hypothetical protein